ncbi:MAG: PepSY domain-containing protein, partial [Burkholderiales bacterium]
TMDSTALYRTIWRWHFYAGLFVIPLILILATTGAIYLFKLQVDRWEERAFQDLSDAHAVSTNLQLDAAIKAFPEANFQSYRLPERPGDAAMIRQTHRDGHSMQDVFVSPQGNVLGTLDPEYRIQKIVQDIHGQLLLGHRGSWIVELAASWAIVMIITGLYLWWPAKEAGGMRGLAGVVWPRMGKGRHVTLRRQDVGGEQNGTAPSKWADSGMAAFGLRMRIADNPLKSAPSA